MLSPKQLLAETAKFFMLNPGRFRKGGLVSGGKSLAADGIIDDDSVCFCTVGYMVARLIKDDPKYATTLKQDGAYVVANAFLRGTGLNAERLYTANDQRGIDGTINFLKEKANAFA